MRVYDWDPIRAVHYGQRLQLPHKQAGHVTAPDQCCRYVRKFLPRRRPHVTQSGRDILCSRSLHRGAAKNLRLRSIVCAARHWFPRVMLFSKVWGSVVSERVLPYIAAIGIGIAAATALSFLSLVLASGIRFGLMH